MPLNNGDKVKVHYTGTLDDGTVFDSSEGREPLEFVIGQGMMIPGFEKAVVEMELGGKTKVIIAPEEAYGVKEEELIFPVPLSEVPEDLTPEIGMVVQLQTTSGQPLDAAIANIDDENIYLDANHPLAGVNLTFEIELVEIESAK